MNIDHKLADMEIELVVARYNECLEWMREPPFCNYKYTVYNKGPPSSLSRIAPDIFTKYITGGAMIDLPNVGRNDQTYMQHILRRYFKTTTTTVKSLPAVTVFLPGSVNMPNKKGMATLILKNLASQTKSFRRLTA